MKLKKYLLSKFIYVLPIEDSFFFKAKFEKKVKLSDELIGLNYKKHAPFKNPFFTTLMENKNLYIWFYQKEIDAKLILPEGYLLFSFFKDKNPNTLLSIEANNGYLILVIKDDVLVNSYDLVEEDEALIAIEMNKHGLSSCLKVTQKEYMKAKDEAFNALSFQDLYKWANFNIENRDLLSTILNRVSYPLAFLLFFMMALEIYHVNKVEERLAEVEASYSEAKSKNDDIREKINSENEKEQKWIEFVHRELPYADALTMMTTISKAFSQKEFVFKSFSIVGSRVKLDMTTKENFIVGLNILNKIDGLKNVALKRTNKKRKTVSYEATIKAKGLGL